jgi:hypothetical protein
MGTVDRVAARLYEVGFGGGSAFVLCPSDVVVEELVVGRSLHTFVSSGLDASDGFEFEGAGNGDWWG